MAVVVAATAMAATVMEATVVEAIMIEAAMMEAPMIMAAVAAAMRPSCRSHLELARGELNGRKVNVRRKCHPFYS